MAIQTVREICESHTLKTLQRTNASHHAMQVARYLTDLTKRHGNVFVHEFESEMVQQWLDEHNWSPCTKSNALKAVRAAFRETEWSCDVSIAVPPCPQLRNHITFETHQLLVEKATPPQAKLLDALYYTGVSLCELINLNVEDVVVTDEGVVWLRRDHRINRPYPTFVPDCLANEVWKLIEGRRGSEPLFVTTNGKRWTCKWVHFMFSKVWDQCGIERQSPSGYRHAFEERLHRLGFGSHIISVLMRGYVYDPTLTSIPYQALFEAVNRVAEIGDGTSEGGE